MAAWTAPAKDGGQPVSNYRYRYVLDDGDGVADANDWDGADSASHERNIGSKATGNANLMVTIDVGEDTHTVATTETLTKEKTYWFQVAAVNENTLADPVAERPEAGSEDWSDAVKFTTGEPTVPDAVEGLMSQHAVDTTGNVTGVLLLWNKPSAGAEPTNYAVEFMDSEGQWVSPATDADDVMGRTSYTDPDEPEADEMRSYRVRAENDAGESPWTMVDFPRDPGTHTTHGTALGEPSNVMATSTTANMLSLEWTPAINADRYILIAVDMSGARNDATGLRLYQSASVSGGTTTSGDVSNLVSGRDYLGIVVALQGTGATRQTENAFDADPATVQ